MSDRPPVQGKHLAKYRPREILVSVAHLEQVKSALGECGGKPSVLDTSAELGLALLSLGSGLGVELLALTNNLQKATIDVTDRSAVAAWERKVPLPAGDNEDLDPVLAALRAYFASRHGGWSPTLGKNRLVGWVGGVDGVVIHQGGEYLKQADEEFEHRPTEPGQGVTVGVLDTRIASHDWLEGGWTAPSSAILSPPPGRPYRPEEGHATFIAGLILSQAPGATVRVRQVLNEQAQADCWTVAKEIVEFGQTGGLDILNLSFACYTEDGQPPLALSTAIDRLDPNIVVVAAAGNHGNLIEPESAESFGNQDLIEREHNMRKPAWPAALDRVIAVGATQDGGNSLAAFTPRDAEWIDLVVDGVDLLSTYLTGDVEVDPATKRSIKFSGWARWSGTSFAAALASGKIAANVRPGQHTARDATRLIQKHADTLRDVSSESTWTPRLVRVDPLRPIRATRRSGIRAIFDRC